MHRKALRVTLCATILGTLTSCILVIPPPPGPTPSKPAGHDLASALPVDLGPDGAASLTGTITSNNRVHVYDLGPCDPGDRIIVSVNLAAGSPLDPTLAVFDAAGELFAHNDDVNVGAGLFNSFLDEIVTVASSHYYVAVSEFFQSTSGGAYVAEVQVQRGAGVPPRPLQTLLLNFAGGSVTIVSEGTIDTAPFDAADIDPFYTGKTAEIKAKIIETVRENFQGTGLVVVTSDDPPPTGTHSTMYFGAFSVTKFGIAQDVDQGNRDCCDDGIVFTDDFDKPFAQQPSVEGVGVAIGNVAAHEAGHLLGLNHVTDVTDLMDTTGTASTLLADQEFKTSPLHSSIFPFGLQNGPAILQRVIPP